MVITAFFFGGCAIGLITLFIIDSVKSKARKNQKPITTSEDKKPKSWMDMDGDEKNDVFRGGLNK